VSHLDLEKDTGNGFLFKTFDSGGLKWAVKEAMSFYNRPSNEKAKHIRRIMKEGKTRFNHSVTAREYIDLYEKMLRRPLINP
jgi:starch synthase/alpha-amylase